MLISYFILFLLLLSVFGSDGYLVARSLKQYYSSLEKEEELYMLRIASLEERRRSASDQSSMDDIALSLGYNRQGETVYYFDEADEVTDYAESSGGNSAGEFYRPVSSAVLALWSLIAPALVLAAMIIRRAVGGRGYSNTETGYEGGRGYDDYSF